MSSASCPVMAPKSLIFASLVAVITVVQGQFAWSGQHYNPTFQSILANDGHPPVQNPMAQLLKPPPPTPNPVTKYLAAAAVIPQLFAAKPAPPGHPQVFFG
uniref:Uncharacterized protein n=1 Tax=Steinernema glaseri TaxID=37863 RepID=A0A1I7Y617_9BILA